MPEKEPLFWQIWNQIASILFVVSLSAIAGVIGYLNKVRRRWHDFSMRSLVVAFLTGGLTGYLTFLLCDLAEWPWQTTAFLTGSAGALGNEALNLLLDRARSIINSTGVEL